MKKAFLSVATALVLLVVMVPFGIGAEQTISSVAIGDLNLPVVGAEPDRAITVGNGCSIYDVEWYDVTTQDFLEQSDRFVLNHVYRAIVWTEAKSGYEFAYVNSYTPDVTATLNNKEATVTKAYEYAAWAMVCVQYDFPACPYEWIQSVEATVIPPVAGTPLVHSVTVPANAKYEVSMQEPSISSHYYRFYNGIQWNIEFQSGVTEGTTAQLGKWYCATVLLKPKKGYAFMEGEDITATINGKNAQIHYQLSDADLLEFSYSGFETFGRIPAFNLQIVEPVVGENPYFYADAEVANVVVEKNEMICIDRTANEYMTAYDVFEAGHTYEFRIDISTATGYRFMSEFDNSYVTVNNTAAEVSDISAIDDRIRVYKTYILESPAPINPFSDVKPADYFYEPVLWAVANNITTGTTPTTFGPTAQCERGQVVTFLWRAAGCPEPQSSANPFTDVSQSAYYYKAVLWAVENGITTGTTPTTFSPTAKCERGQIVTFLWRFAGKPAAVGNNPFTDVKSTDYYYTAVLWAVENGITTGTGEGKFSPTQICERCQVVTFLYRYLK